jgi:hypothetical protein
MTSQQILAWAVAHPEHLAAGVVALRALYALASRIAAPYPRARAVVEGIAALGPDVLRAAQQIGSAVLGRPLPSLDVRAPDDDRARLRDSVAAQAARILELERENLTLRGGAPHRTPGGA